MWAPFKEILATVETAVLHKRSEVYAELDENLTKYKSIFIGLLKNPSKNASHREQIQKANKVNINLNNYVGGIKLHESTIEDALLLSDALDVNEMSCVELMLLAEKQLPNFPGLTIPLVAALLYHDGRRCLLSALKLLLTARPGITWTLELDDRIVELIEKFVEQLIEDGLVSKILQLLEEISLPKELKKLQDARCLDNSKQKKLVTEQIQEQQMLLADCLFCMASQFPFEKDDCVKLLNYLKLVAPNTSDGSLDFVTLRILLALCACFNCDIIDLAVENIENEQYKRLPYFKDKTFIIQIHQAIVRPDVQVWQTPAIKYLIQFFWSIFLRTCSTHSDLVDLNGDVIEQDETTLETSLDGDALRYLAKAVISSEKFHEEEYFLKIVHSFITSFIVKFPLKMKELRNRGDENARILQAHISEGIEPPVGLKHDFQVFMQLIASLYKDDPLELELNNEYWIPPEPLGGVFSPHPLRKSQQTIDQRKLMLNKFVRLAGDILLQPLYVPYIKMLTALSNNKQAASYCFRLLSSNGSHDSSGTCAVSWNHFFLSIKQYYLSLRHVADSPEHRPHLHRHHEISPDELAGLESVLKLIKVVAEKSESIRIAFCENQTWLPVASLFGLVCCPIPPSMKGLLLDTLAAFSKTPEIAASVWQSLEASQVLQTTKPLSGTTVVKSGIAVELQEIETRNETYPETRAFIKLLDVLTDITIPPTLGAGHRIPGFDPYLDFLIDQVFLKFKTRAYQNTSEKWEIASAVLKIFIKLLKSYDPHPDHFMNQQVEIQGINFGKAAKPSGFHLLTYLLSDTPVLRMILSVFDETVQELLNVLSTSSIKDLLEQTVGSCLKLLEVVFEKQNMFMEFARSCQSSLVLSPLDELFLSVNPRTGRPDYLHILGRLMTINNLNTSLLLVVVQVFKHVCEGSKAQREIVEILTQDEISSREVLVGFCEQLEVSDPEEEDQTDSDNLPKLEDSMEGNQRDLIRQNIVALLISTLHQPTPNMAQFMLGFEIRRPISKTNLQDPGIGNFPKTCLHSVIDILNRGLNDRSDAALTPKLTELLYQLIYMLCAHQEMGSAIRRYLRTNTDFFIHHCRSLPFLPLQNQCNLYELLYIRLANQQSWLLKALAIELRVVAASRMRSGLQQLLILLYNEQVANDLVTQSVRNENMTMLEPQVTKRDTLSQTMFSSCFTFGAENSSLILSLINSLSLTQRYPPDIHLNYFDYSAIEQLIVSCEEMDKMGVMLCNVKKLFRILMNEISSSQFAVTSVQKEEILKEVRAVVKHAVDRNLVRESFHAKHNAFDAWRQVVEVTFAVSSLDVMSVEKKQNLLTEILQIIIPMMSDEENLPELTSAIGGTILSLMANLWFSFTQIDATITPPNSYALLPSITALFPGIVKSLVKAGSAQARVRANLYGAFLYYIQIGNLHTSITGEEGVTGGIFSNQSKENWEINTLKDLENYGDLLLDIVAKDACQGPCIARMMAISVLDALISLDWKHKYVAQLSSRGHLRVLVDQLLEDDVELVQVLSVQPQSMKPLYLFESKMSLLARIVSTDYGAQLLLQAGLILRLTECQFLDFHIDKATAVSSTITFTTANDPFMPALLDRYIKMFTAFAKLLLSFLSSVGIHHQVAISQVQDLIMNHRDVITRILQDGGEIHSINSLKHLSLTIAIISVLPIVDNKDDGWEELTDNQRYWRVFMNRVQQHIGLLLRRYSSSTLEKQMQEILDQEHSHDSTIKISPFNVVTMETQNTLLQIRSRILTFCKNVVSSQGLSGPYSRTLFAPVIGEKLTHETRLITGKSQTTKQLPALSVLVQELKDCPEELRQCLENMKVLQRKLDFLNDMTYEEMKEILSQEEDTDRLPHHQRQVVVRRILMTLIKLREAEADCLCYNIEHVIYILWRHIDYYYVHCHPTDDSYLEDGGIAKSFHSRRARRLTDGSFTSFTVGPSLYGRSPAKYDRLSTRDREINNGVTQEELKAFKAEASTVLVDSLWKKVLESEQLYARQRSRLSFSSALVRRLKGLIQLNS